MSRHEGVSCDSCLKENFKGKRYKCLICYDYDLCEICYDGGAATARHQITHPMQCILTRIYFELHYAGEPALQYPNSFTCPYCGNKGFTEIDLTDHVITVHGPMNIEVLCPICAASSLGRSNIAREDFIGHLNLEHRNPSRELIFFDEAPRQSLRRIHIQNSRLNTSRGRRTNMNFSAAAAAAAAATANNRDNNTDPIAELLTQFSGVRRAQQAAAAASAPLPTPPERQTRVRQTGGVGGVTAAAAVGNAVAAADKRTVSIASQNVQQQQQTTNQSAISLASQITIMPNYTNLLVPDCLKLKLSDEEQIHIEELRADRSLFLSKLILDTLKKDVQLNSDQILSDFIVQLNQNNK